MLIHASRVPVNYREILNRGQKEVIYTTLYTEILNLETICSLYQLHSHFQTFMLRQVATAPKLL